MVQELHARFSTPNFRAAVSGEVLGIAVAGPVDDTAPIDDYILGTTLHGTGHTVGETKVCLTPDPSSGYFDAVMHGVNESQNVGEHAPVWIYSHATTQVAVVKRMWVNSQGLHSHPAVGAAETHSVIDSIQAMSGRKFVENAAWRRAEQQHPEADAIASEHAGCRVAQRADAQADPMIEDANKQFAQRRRPLDERLIFPQMLESRTTETAVEVFGMQAVASQFAAPAPPPALAHPADICMQIHESAINNTAATMLAGMRLTEDMFQRTAAELLGSVPETLKPDPSQEPFTLVFQGERPITVSFADNGYTITLRGQKFISGDQTRPAMNIAASYKIEKTPQGFKGVREGELEIYAPGRQAPIAASASRRSGPCCTRRFSKLFPPEMLFQGFTPKGRLAKAGKFVPAEVSTSAGWLTVGWCRQAAAPAATTAVAAN